MQGCRSLQGETRNREGRVKRLSHDDASPYMRRFLHITTKDPGILPFSAAHGTGRIME